MDLFLCHSAEDREVAGLIAERLERGAEAKVWLEECGREQTVAMAWEGGLSSRGILLLLSPEVVPRLTREAWHGLLRHCEGNGAPPVGSLLTADCAYPRLLERRRFWRWGEDNRQALREMERWALTLHGEGAGSGFVAAKMPRFDGRQAEIDWLWETLVDEAGAALVLNEEAGSGKTSLAQEFARVARGHFRDVLWVACGERTEASLLAELAARLSVEVERIPETLEERRLLVVLDDLAGPPPVMGAERGRASVLITARRMDWNPPRHLRILPVERVGPGVAAEVEGEARQLWEAAGVCGRNTVLLELAARVAGLGDGAARAAGDRLVEMGLLDPLDAAGLWFRRREGAEPGDAPRRRHAEVVLEVFEDWQTRGERCLELLVEWDAAFSWALHGDWDLVKGLARRGFAFLMARGRVGEAVEVMERLRQAAFEREEWTVVEECAWELSWIHGDGGGILREVSDGGQMGFDFR